MYTISALLAAGLLASTSEAAPRFSHGDGTFTDHIAKRTFTKGQCSDDDFGRFAADYSAGIGYVNKVKTIVAPGNWYWVRFFGPSYQDQSWIDDYKTNYLDAYAGLSNAEDINITINCRTSANEHCNDPPPPGTDPSFKSTAYTDRTVPSITLCDPYFSQPADADASDDWCNDGRSLDEFETGAFTVLHESGHLDYKLDEPLEDYAYGSYNCMKLAESDEDKAFNNADNWMLTAMGIYWADRCGKTVTLDNGPVGPGTTTFGGYPSDY